MNFFDRFYENLKNYPNWIVVEDEKISYTNSDLEKISGKVFSFLLKKGIGKEDVVAIKLKKSPICVALALGVFKAGACFTFFCETSSKKQEQVVYTEVKPKIIIDKKVLKEILGTDYKQGNKTYDQHDLAYIVYSSGSTGVLKGCMQEYGSVEDSIKCLRRSSFDYLQDRAIFFSGTHTFSFIAFFINVCVASAYVYFAKESLQKNTKKLHNYLVKKNIKAFAISPEFKKDEKFFLGTNIKYICFAYEPTSMETLKEIALYNEYSFTEAGHIVFEFLIDKDYEIVPVGKPIIEDDIYLADENGNKVKDGEIGELYVRLPFFRGYAGRSDLTKSVMKDGWYHSGDMLMMLPSGNYVMLGRKIDLIKAKEGYVVPALITAKAKKSLNLPWAFVKVFENNGKISICLYYQDGKLDIKTVRKTLGLSLSPYMLPTHIKKLKKIPLLNCGKVNSIKLLLPKK